MSYAGTVIAFPAASPKSRLVFFSRSELNMILNMYGRLVSAGTIRDYAIYEERDQVAFSLFRRASERPAYNIVKARGIKKKKTCYRVVDPAGQVLKRSENLRAVLSYFEPKLIKLVKA